VKPPGPPPDDAVLRAAPVRAAIAEAARRGFAVRCRDLGDWGGRVRPCAELDPAARTIVLDARLLAAALARLGPARAQALAATAIRHELAHAADPHASEREIRAYLRAAAADDPDGTVRAALVADART